jgi:hypothetical protein
VLTSGFFTLLLAARVLYRQGFHGWGWDTRRATSLAALLLSGGTLALYLALFAKVGWGAALMGGLVLVGLVAALATQRGRRRTSDAGLAPSFPWTIMLFVSLVLLGPGSTVGQAAEGPACTSAAHPPRHFFFAVDLSGSMRQYLAAMRALVTRSLQLCVKPGDDLTLITFAQDPTSTVQERLSFTVPPDGSLAPLLQALNDLAIQHPRDSQTLFRPLAEFLNQRLPQVQKDPVVLVLSDGKSDAPAQDLPFRSFAVRGLYSVEGMQGWMVAIQGGTGLDFTAVFTGRPLPPPPSGPSKPRPVSEGIDPCLIEPALIVEAPAAMQLRPPWHYPWSGKVIGELVLRVWHGCPVTRSRSMTVQVRLRNAPLTLGHVDNTVITPEPRSFAFPLALAMRGGNRTEAQVALLLDQGGTLRAITPTQPAFVTLTAVSYWTAFGVYGCVLGGLLLLGSGLAGWTWHRRRVWEQAQPEFVRIIGGSGVALARGQAVLLGGGGCSLTVPGVAPGMELALVTWDGRRGELTLQAQAGVHMKVNGEEVRGSAPYRLGQPLQFTDPHGTVWDVMLHRGSPGDGPISGTGFADAGSPLGSAEGGMPTLFGDLSLNGTSRPTTPYTI